ncbi:MAG: adenylate/guanylate cyclase domain-containing protein [Burkholderiales bacterium]|nr:adenylate/guanylate cyclase domain-containing protein [Burkholderiales bacterium]
MFTDIEGSTRLWEQEPVRMHRALAAHDDLSRRLVRQHRGEVVKMTGDGVHAVFADPVDALRAAIGLQLALADPAATANVALRVRCGLHTGSDSRRGRDFYGTAVNRAARVMSAAHGGQVLVSSAVAALIRDRLPAGVGLRDLGAVRLRDLREPEVLFQVDHPELRREFPALRALAATPHNLPLPLTSFVGRDRELADARALLSATRLLTLVGIGGLGKSRLSLELARAVRDEYIDGVWFVELAAVSDPRLVPHAVAAVLGVKEEGQQGLAAALRAFVANRKLLLVLDNCEHLAQACADVARALLEAGPDLRIVATSRERLGIQGEQTCQIAPLAVPAPGEAAESVASYAAVRLFVERAQAVRPDFQLDAGNSAQVANICQRLDGIPLALELAAARTSALSVAAIAARLSDRFRLLRQGDRTALPRQQTLRALIDWSHDLLDERERTLFRRLSVFAGGFTLEAAETLAADETMPAADIVDLAARLVEKSLVVHDAAGERYFMLETVRQYADELLAERGERRATQARHLEHYVGLAEAARTELAGAAQRAALTRLDRELDNIVAAHRCCDTADDGAALGLRLVSSLMLYWIHRGKFELGRRVTAEALGRSQAQAPGLDRCRALFRAGQLALLAGGYDESVRYLQESLDLARTLDVPAAASAVLAPLAVAAIHQGRLDTARAYLVESRALAEQLGDKRNLAVALNETGQLDRIEGGLPSARVNFQAALALARALADRESVAVALLNLAMVELSSHSPASAASAARMLGEVHAIVDDMGSRHTAPALLDVAAVLAARRMHWDSAARLFVAAKAMAVEIGLRAHPADEAFLAPVVAQTRTRVGEAGWQEAAARPAALADGLREVARIVADES